MAFDHAPRMQEILGRVQAVGNAHVPPADRARREAAGAGHAVVVDGAVEAPPMAVARAEAVAGRNRRHDVRPR